MPSKSRPHASAPLSCDDPATFSKLTDAEQHAIKLWISFAIRPAKTKHWSSSYGLKHHLERDTRNYFTNGQFKGAMLAKGYDPVDPWAKNWRFRIRPASRLDSLKHGDFNINHLSETERQELKHAFELAYAAWKDCHRDGAA